MSQGKITTTKKLQASIALIILTAVLVGSEVTFHDKSATVATTNSKTAGVTTPTKTTTSSTTTYKDGSYTARGSYDSPGGTESLTVRLTLTGDKVSAAKVQAGANDPTALSYQMSFINGYKRFVVGKDITSIRLTNVSGSSLTSQGFNEALKNIERQAAA
jgi:uncharacterized protein with FMN-binding domain